jgi:hypothetical protein
MSGAQVKLEATSPPTRRKGKGPWMTDTDAKLSQAIEIGLRSSGKADTREHRVTFYTEQLTKAKLEVAYYSEMLELEVQRDKALEGRPGKHDQEIRELEAELQVLTLRARVKDCGRANEGVATPATTVADDGGSSTEGGAYC